MIAPRPRAARVRALSRRTENGAFEEQAHPPDHAAAEAVEAADQAAQGGGEDRRLGQAGPEAEAGSQEAGRSPARSTAAGGRSADLRDSAGLEQATARSAGLRPVA